MTQLVTLYPQLHEDMVRSIMGRQYSSVVYDGLVTDDDHNKICIINEKKGSDIIRTVLTLSIKDGTLSLCTKRLMSPVGKVKSFITYDAVTIIDMKLIREFDQWASQQIS